MLYSIQNSWHNCQAHLNSSVSKCFISVRFYATLSQYSKKRELLTVHENFRIITNDFGNVRWPMIMTRSSIRILCQTYTHLYNTVFESTTMNQHCTWHCFPRQGPTPADMSASHWFPMLRHLCWGPVHIDCLWWWTLCPAEWNLTEGNLEIKNTSTCTGQMNPFFIYTRICATFDDNCMETNSWTNTYLHIPYQQTTLIYLSCTYMVMKPG